MKRKPILTKNASLVAVVTVGETFGGIDDVHHGSARMMGGVMVVEGWET